MNEFKIINNYFKVLSRKNPPAINLNDDVFFDKKSGIVISVDTYNSNIHFKDFMYPQLIIKKIIRSSLSDLICKGVTPKFYFLSGSGNKKTFTKKNLRESPFRMRRTNNSNKKKYTLGATCVNSANARLKAIGIMQINLCLDPCWQRIVSRVTTRNARS